MAHKKTAYLWIFFRCEALTQCGFNADRIYGCFTHFNAQQRGQLRRLFCAVAALCTILGMAIMMSVGVAAPDTKEAIDEEVEVSAENLYKVVAHDDDKTTMDFVIRVMVQIFKKPFIFAEAILSLIHI